MVAFVGKCTIVHGKVAFGPCGVEDAVSMHDRSLGGLGEAARARRVELGLKQVELAELARCSTRFVHMVEAGKATVRFDKLLDLLAVLGLGFHLSLGARLVVPAKLVEVRR